MSRHALVRPVRSALAAGAALVLTAGASVSTVHAQTVIAAAGADGGGAAVVLAMSPGATGIPTIDNACLGNEITITGTGTGTLGVAAAGLFNVPGFPVPVPAGAGAEYIPSDFEVSGGACAGNTGPIVLDMHGNNPINGAFFSCSGMSGTFTSSGLIYLFTVSGTCVINGLTPKMTFSSVGLLTANVPAVASTNDIAVLSAAQAATCC